ncbi:MAG: DHCW motif cupin fold protein [Thermoplasmata archaeon]
MKLPPSEFTLTDWEKQPSVEVAGERGFARICTQQWEQLRIRVVVYSPGYIADHWCTKGHLVYIVEGEVETELRDGRKFRLTPGMSYRVSESLELPHRSSTRTGAKLFIVD